MITSSVRAFAIALLVVPAAAVAAPQMPAPGQPVRLSAQLVRGFQSIQGDLAATAERMPAEHYGFRPTPEIKPFGQLVVHVALAQFRDCAMLKGEESPKTDEKDDVDRTKAEAVALLKASIDYCTPLVSALNTEAMMTELVAVDRMQVAKGLIPAHLLVHGMEMYGTMAVYLRLKGFVPPTTERQGQQMKTSEQK
jgi:hypothetical protein